MKIVVYHKNEIMDVIENVVKVIDKDMKYIKYDGGSVGELNDEYYYYLTEDEVDIYEITLEERVSQYKELKTMALNHKCEEEIMFGFYSSALGEEHFYAFSEKDQANFSMQLAFLNVKETLSEIAWKTEDAGVLLHTKEQFLKVCEDGEAHKRSMISHYWTKKAEVAMLTTLQEIDEMSW